MNKIIFWLLVVCMPIKDSNAVLPGAVLAGTLGATIISLKVGHYYQQKAALERQANYLKLINSFKQEDWQKFRNYPHAAKIVKELFENRDLSPKNFSFTWDKDWAFSSSHQIFSFNESQLRAVNELLLLDQNSFSKSSVEIEYLEGKFTLSTKEYIGLIRFIIGHEIQHAFDSRNIQDIKKLVNDIKLLIKAELKVLENEKGYFSKNTLSDCCANLEQLRILEDIEETKCTKKIRPYEKKADSNASLKFEELRIGARYYQWLYEQHIQLDPSKWEYFYKHEDEHPHPLERARYLRELADELEKKQQEKQAKQAQFEQKYLVLPN